MGGFLPKECSRPDHRAAWRPGPSCSALPTGPLLQPGPGQRQRMEGGRGEAAVEAQAACFTMSRALGRQTPRRGRGFVQLTPCMAQEAGGLAVLYAGLSSCPPPLSFLSPPPPLPSPRHGHTAGRGWVVYPIFPPHFTSARTPFLCWVAVCPDKGQTPRFSCSVGGHVVHCCP